MNRYTIRPMAYRGRSGFSVSGCGARVFTESRESAEIIREKLRNKVEIQIVDFQQKTHDTEAADGDQ